MSTLKAIDDLLGGLITGLFLTVVAFVAFVMLAGPTLLPMLIIRGSSLCATSAGARSRPTRWPNGRRRPYMEDGR